MPEFYQQMSLKNSKYSIKTQKRKLNHTTVAESKITKPSIFHNLSVAEMLKDIDNSPLKENVPPETPVLEEKAKKIRTRKSVS